MTDMNKLYAANSDRTPKPFKPGVGGDSRENGANRYGAEGSSFTPGQVTKGDFDGITLSDHPVYGPAAGHNRDHLSGAWVVEAGAVSVRSLISAAEAALKWEQAVAAAKP